ncbi:GYDIA family GHMP kinase [Aestuariibaculum lutulentum]|uniref:GYDIA family GHMP kinase n=1 Tax=Aestuariibaculum lutulentum TaxID=2920935 RepID=A0ABS9RKU0_9FLAO|nr:GYDIA family GHMP kinase [Aestuariibaculum lutulentum]MCH4553574.1 GYDIA family GHMP kinase [Aestuariibaculum lutulentum]
MQEFYSNGKLLISGEYVVLDGAKALALPTKFGQSLTIMPIDETKLFWKSYNNDKSLWFEGTFDIENGTLKAHQDNEVSNRIVQILQTAQTLNPDFLSSNQGYNISTALTFPKNWGLGTSSTLINNIADWAEVNAYELLKNTFGGSGYDIACAQNNLPITFQRTQNDIEVNALNFNPEFKEHIYFVYLNEKQNSREGIATYNSNKSNIEPVISEINKITELLLNCESLTTFEDLLTQHESIISKVIKQQTVKDRLFPDFNGVVKSLGAWGGDFVLVASEDDPTSYFKTKGYHTILRYQDMIL